MLPEEKKSHQFHYIFPNVARQYKLDLMEERRGKEVRLVKGGSGKYDQNTLYKILNKMF